MPELDVMGAYLRFVASLGIGLWALSVGVSLFIDHFFTEHSVKDYRFASLLRQIQRDRAADADLDVEDVSLADLASQLTQGRHSRRKEAELYRKSTLRSHRGILSR